MKHADRMLMHHIDHATGDRLPSKFTRNVVWACMLIGSHALAFIAGLLINGVRACVGH